MKLADDLREFVELLNSENVEYVIVGGHAVGYHGYPRYTGDIDIFVRSDSSNAARIVAVLDAFGFGNLGADGGGHVMALNVSGPRGVWGYYKQVYGAQGDPTKVKCSS